VIFPKQIYLFVNIKNIKVVRIQAFGQLFLSKPCFFLLDKKALNIRLLSNILKMNMS
jgi:hypothetical protein